MCVYLSGNSNNLYFVQINTIQSNFLLEKKWSVNVNQLKRNVLCIYIIY